MTLPLIVSDTFGVDTQYMEDFVMIENCYNWDTLGIEKKWKTEKQLDLFLPFHLKIV